MDRDNDGDGGFGGGIFNTGSLTVIASTFSGNEAIGDTMGCTGGDGLGGAIFDDAGSSATILNSTLAENQAIGGNGSEGRAGQGQGGGIFNKDAALVITNSTIADNLAVGGSDDLDGSDTDDLASGQGGGIYTVSCGNTAARAAREHHRRGQHGRLRCRCERYLRQSRAQPDWQHRR